MEFQKALEALHGALKAHHGSVEARPNKCWLPRGCRGSAGAENSYHGAVRARPRVVKIVPEALEAQSRSSGGSLLE